VTGGGENGNRCDVDRGRVGQIDNQPDRTSVEGVAECPAQTRNGPQVDVTLQLVDAGALASLADNAEGSFGLVLGDAPRYGA
jgi:hypothetical protein